MGKWFCNSTGDHHDNNDHHYDHDDRARNHGATNDTGADHYNTVSADYLGFSGVGLGVKPIV
jgi:hypothetical protein